jgi:hypothetical protein
MSEGGRKGVGKYPRVKGGGWRGVTNRGIARQVYLCSILLRI